MNSERAEVGARGNSPALRVDVIADSDTRWKWGAGVAETLLAGAEGVIDGHLLHGRATPNDRQLADVGADVESVRRAGIADVVTGMARTDADVVVLACIGGTIQSLLHALARAWESRETRPVVVTGYVGLVYEHMTDGLLLRAGADVVLANSAYDARRFTAALDAVGADSGGVVQTALPFLGGVPHDPTAAGDARPFTVCFVAQPSVPASKKERQYAIDACLEHARRHPERQVVVKLRGRPREQTTHVEDYHYAKLAEASGQPLPPNLEFAYGSMADVLDRTDLCVTVSSTAALEAMARGIPTGILTDFGIRETLGNHAFLEAGAYISWRQLHEGAVPKPDPAWMADNGVVDDAPYGALRARVASLLAERAALPPLRPWLTLDDAGGYLPNLLARNGLKPTGVPIESWAAGETFPRRVARALAQRAYRLATDRIEPKVRRLAQQ